MQPCAYFHGLIQHQCIADALGNICRSPTAEAVFKSVVDRSGVADEFTIDSCGTGGGNENWYHFTDNFVFVVLHICYSLANTMHITILCCV